MGSPSIPAQPPPPDLAAANREGIYSDIETLPIRNQINQAAQLGQRIEYVDPATGQTKVADFTGMGNAAAAQQAATILSDTNAAMQRQQLSLRQELGTANAAQTAAEIQAADPLAYQTRQALTGKVLGSLNQPANNATSSATGRLGNIYDQVTQIDPGAGADETSGLVRTAMMQGQDPTGASRLGSIYSDASKLPTSFNDPSMLALLPALGGAVNDYALGGRLNDQEMRYTTDNVRAGQASRGNFLGDAAAVQEAVSQNAASDAKKQQRLQNLMAIQQQVFGQGDSLRNESQQAALARIGAMSGLQGQGFGQEQQRAASLASMAQQLFGNQQQVNNAGLARLGTMAGIAGQQAQDDRATRAENFGYDQQRLANASAMVLGQPITNQFGSLGGAQQGAVGFTPIQYNQVGQTNANAAGNAANFAQGNFGNMANMWNTNAGIAAQGNPWLQLAGATVGGLVGSKI